MTHVDFFYLLQFSFGLLCVGPAYQPTHTLLITGCNTKGVNTSANHCIFHEIQTESFQAWLFFLDDRDDIAEPFFLEMYKFLLIIKNIVIVIHK